MKQEQLKQWFLAVKQAWWISYNFEHTGTKHLYGEARISLGYGDFSQLYQQKSQDGSLATYLNSHKKALSTGNFLSCPWRRFKSWWRNETSFVRYCENRQQFDSYTALLSPDHSTSAINSCDSVGVRQQRLTRSDRQRFSNYLKNEITVDGLTNIATELQSVGVEKRPGILGWLSKKILAKKNVAQVLIDFFKQRLQPQRVTESQSQHLQDSSVADSPSLVPKLDIEAIKKRCNTFTANLPVVGDDLDTFKKKFAKLIGYLDSHRYREVVCFRAGDNAKHKVNVDINAYQQSATRFVQQQLGISADELTNEEVVICQQRMLQGLYTYESYQLCNTFLKTTTVVDRAQHHNQLTQLLGPWLILIHPDKQLPSLRELATYNLQMLTRWVGNNENALSRYDNLEYLATECSESAREHTRILLNMRQKMVEMNDAIHRGLDVIEKKSQDTLTELSALRENTREINAMLDTKTQALESGLSASRAETQELKAMIQQLLQAQQARDRHEQPSGQTPVGTNQAGVFGATANNVDDDPTVITMSPIVNIVS